MAKRETLAERKQRTKRIIRGLRKQYPDADCALKHSSALELLVATILSAQSTDVMVNKITPILFAQYPDADSLATADPARIEKIIHPTGFFRQKTKSIVGAARVLVDEFEGQVPDNMNDLLRLPGVARKTANVVLGTWFHKNEGVVVDTHVGRVADRLRLATSHKDAKDAKRIEAELMEVVPRADWTWFGHAVIWHGRDTCTARKPDCPSCVIAKDCPSAGTFDGKAAPRGRKAGAGKTAGRTSAVRKPKSAKPRRRRQAGGRP